MATPINYDKLLKECLNKRSSVLANTQAVDKQVKGCMATYKICKGQLDQEGTRLHLAQADRITLQEKTITTGCSSTGENTGQAIVGAFVVGLIAGGISRVFR